MTDRDLYVEIRPRTEDESDPGYRRMGPFGVRDATRIDVGININLNHERYYTRIVAADGGHWRSDASLEAEQEYQEQQG